ncbi:hypothetical protein [Streptomyces thinghirensis]|uniref:Uncharacterized protein n=1 Tax=Streptomyces thinghirensis TaxID=551547 RepID=A0ABP9TFG0_9ACTN
MIARPGPGPLRRPVVLRHPKPARPAGVADHDRPLAGRGRRDAPAAGRAPEVPCAPPPYAPGELVPAPAGDALDDTPDRVRAKYPTSAFVVRDWHGTTWRALSPGAAPLTAMTVPRGVPR